MYVYCSGTDYLYPGREDTFHGNRFAGGAACNLMARLFRTVCVDPFTQVFADLKEREFFGGNLNLFPGFWISTGIGVILLDHKRTKSPDFNRIPSCKGITHGIDNGVGN